MTEPPALQRHPIPAVGVVCFDDDGKVVLIRRGNPPRKGQWSLPGGKIEMGEAAQAAALRELREETGLEAELFGLVDVVDAIYAARHYVLVDYVARVVGGTLVAGDDAADAAMFALADMLTLGLWDETERVILKAAAMMGVEVPLPVAPA